MKKRLLKVISFLFVSILLFACIGGTDEKVDPNNKVSEKVIGGVAGGTAQKTIMFYVIGSDLEENVMGGTEMVAALSKVKNPENLNLVIMTGGSVNENGEATRQDEYYKGLYENFYNINWEQNQIWEVRDGLKVVEEDFGYEDMTKGATLEKFLKYVKKNFPANTYDIIFSDHGGAALYSFGTDTRYQEEAGCITLKELEDAFKNTDMKFATVGFDACLMASFELMCVLEPYSDYLIAAEETAFGSWDYSFLDEVSNDVNIDPVTYGKSIVDKFITVSEVNANSLGVFALKGFREKVDRSLTEFCKNMNKYLSEDDYLIDLYRILNYTIGLGYTSIRDIRDLRDFLDWIENIENSELPAELKNSAGTLWRNIEEFIIYFRTCKAKNEDGSERTGGLNFVFPNKNVNYEDDELDEALLSMASYPESLNEDFRLMFKLAFLRKSLVTALNDNAKVASDNEVKNVLSKLCDRAYEKYKIPKTYIDSIKNNIVPLLASNRIKVGDDANIGFEKEVKNNQVSFNLTFDNDIAWMLYEPNAVARTYDIDGKELSLGSIAVVPQTKTIEGDKNIWHIVPEEDRWFTIDSNNYEYLVQFIVTEEVGEDKKTSMNNLFNSSISGFIPAIIKRYEDDVDADNIIQIHVEFKGSGEKGKVLGFTRYDQNSNMSAKEIESFKKSDMIKLIANFEDFSQTKNITYLGYNEIPADNFEVLRGYTVTQNVYFKYNAEDIYGLEYEFDIENQFAFELGDADDNCLYATFPSTWTDVTIDTSDSSFESWSIFGQHKEKIKVNLYDVTNDATNFGNVAVGEAFPDATIEYLANDKEFEYVTEQYNGWITGAKNEDVPILTIEGLDKNEKFLTKKYILFMMDERKLLIEFSTLVDDKSGNEQSHHDMRLIRTAQELMYSIYPSDNYTIKQKIVVK